jgi:hypothetical protein
MAEAAANSPSERCVLGGDESATQTQASELWRTNDALRTTDATQ